MASLLLVNQHANFPRDFKMISGSSPEVPTAPQKSGPVETQVQRRRRCSLVRKFSKSHLEPSAARGPSSSRPTPAPPFDFCDSGPERQTDSGRKTSPPVAVGPQTGSPGASQGHPLGTRQASQGATWALLADFP